MLFSAIVFMMGVAIQPHSTIEIHTVYPNGAKGGGSGVIIEKNKILTAFHVLKDVSSAQATCNGKILNTKAISFSVQLDLALMEYTENCDIAPIKLAETNAEVGTDLWAIGHPVHLPLMITRGVVSGYSLDKKTFAPEMWSDVKVWYGNSGGPAINDKGELIGLLISMLNYSNLKIENGDTDIDYQSYACLAPLSSIKYFLAKSPKK